MHDTWLIQGNVTQLRYRTGVAWRDADPPLAYSAASRGQSEQPPA
jgi:hypothetical protein